MGLYRAAVLVAVGVAPVGGTVAMGAAAWTADHCEIFAGSHGGAGHAVCGSILHAYRGQHGPDGGLGPPTSDEHAPEPSAYQSPGHRQQAFDYGVIDLTVANGRTRVLRGTGWVPNT